MKAAKIKYKTRSGEYWTVCPHCEKETRTGVWAVAHTTDCDLTFTCPECKEQSIVYKRSCELADKVDE